LGIVTAVVASFASVCRPDCIHGAPAGWVTAPAQPSDQFVVWAPPAYVKLAEDAAKTIRGKNFFGYYESKLNIAHLGFANQAASGRFEIFLDPDLRSALKNADGLTAKRCENPAREGIDIYAGINDDEVFHAAIAHELFHAAQSQVAGDFDDNWWFEATATWAETRFGYSTPVPEDFSSSVTEVTAGEDTSNDEFPLADPLGARILRVKPTSKVNQLVVSIKKLPAGADVYIRLGKARYWNLDAGHSFEETFCRSGALKGSLELPSTGDVRIAITSLAGAGNGEVKLKLIGDHKACPKSSRSSRGWPWVSCTWA
jgi:hypothetical protein